MPEVTYKVAMTCGGCSKAITSLVSKVDGVEKVEASHETKLVTVRTKDGADVAAVTAAIKKTGKAILEGPAIDGAPVAAAAAAAAEAPTPPKK